MTKYILIKYFVINIFLMLSLILLGCNYGPTSHVKPNNVPASAFWIGGVDGGVFIVCDFDGLSKTNKCTVYNDATGDIIASGQYILKGKKCGVNINSTELSGSDGIAIYLKNGSVLVPSSSIRPQNVPESAVLSENGVYVDSMPSLIKKNTYFCSLFLSSTGEKIGSGTYELESEVQPLSEIKLIPKLVTREIIHLECGAVLRRVS